MKQKLKKLAKTSKAKILRRSPQGEKRGAPRITNDTVASHREEVLSSARKYIYPLQHSRHRVVIISVTLFTVAVVAFFAYMLLSLYRYHTTSTFAYNVTRVLPFPIAKAGPAFVAYENYLFEVRRYKHYYETQQRVNFDEASGQEQLRNFEKQALDTVIQDAFVKQLAETHEVTVSNAEVDEQVELMRSQNRLGGSEQVLEDVLHEYWGWSVKDFKRQLHKELLAQKVLSVLDMDTKQAATKALEQIRAGGDFAAIAREQSDDASTTGNGGNYGIDITRSSVDVGARVVDELFALKKDQVSGLVATPQGIEIVKVLETDGNVVHAAHILFEYQDIATFTKPLQDERGLRKFVGL